MDSLYAHLRTVPALLFSNRLHAHNTCTWFYVCIHVAACLQLCLPPQASPPSHTQIVCPNVCMPVCPGCMPIARLGLIHNTMPSHILTPFSKSLVNVWVCGMYVRLHVCVCACHKAQIESLRLSTCECMYMCVLCVNVCTYNNGGLKVGWYACTSLLIGIHA